MARRISHSEQRWAQIEADGIPLRRCKGSTAAGSRCKRVAMAGSVMCDRHTSHLAEVQKQEREEWMLLAPVARREAERILKDPNASDTAKTNVMKMVNEATGMKEADKVVVDLGDPVEALFQKILSSPDGLEPRRVDPAPGPPALESGEVVRGEVVDRIQDDYDRRVDPIPENVVPLDGWADVDQPPPRKPSIFDPPTDAEEAKQAARIPKNIRDRLG